MSSNTIHLGFDDIDSPAGGCTTHFASIVVQYLAEKQVKWLDYPNLIRLNPGIPFRTRGNGAVALRFKAPTEMIDDLTKFIETKIHTYVDEKYPNTNPGTVIVKDTIPEAIKQFSKQALWKTIPIEFAKRLILKLDVNNYMSGNGRGLVGALAAIGNTLQDDYTYEYIAYRPLSETSSPRGVDKESVIEMDRIMGGRVFSNLDSDRSIIDPHGPDPVLYGIRGESATDVIEASKYISSKQNVQRWMVFRSNQGTAEHLTHLVSIKDLRPYMATKVKGTVDSRPRMIEGGHMIFSISDGISSVDCAAYEPTHDLRKVVAELRKGDEILVHASVRPKARTHPQTLNIEGLEIMRLTQVMSKLNPVCPHCLKRMKSAGKHKGYKCPSCGFKDPGAKKTESEIVRDLKKGLYLPPPTAQRHLTRPYSRLRKHNKGVPKKLLSQWHYP